LLSSGTVYIRFGVPISPQGHTAESLKDEVRKAVIELKKDLPPPIANGKEVYEEEVTTVADKLKAS